LLGPIRTLSGPDDPEHVVLPQLHAFFYNYFGFLLSYFIGLQFTYLDSIMFLRRVGDKIGTPSLWKTYKVTEVLCLFPILGSVLSVVALHIFFIISYPLWKEYIVCYGVFLGGLVLITLILRKTHYLHMHHYFIFGTLIPLAAFSHPVSVVALGLVAGIYTEGAARWGYDPLWIKGERHL